MRYLKNTAFKYNTRRNLKHLSSCVFIREIKICNRSYMIKMKIPLGQTRKLLSVKRNYPWNLSMTKYAFPKAAREHEKTSHMLEENIHNTHT